MKKLLRIAIVDPNDSTREGLKAMLLGMDMLWLEAEASRYEFFADVVNQTHPDIGLVSIDNDPEKALDLVALLSANHPECSVLIISSSSEGDLILRAMRAGAKEYLTQPVTLQDLLNALDRIGTQRAGSGGQSRNSSVISVAGVTGGVGSTSVAVNLGCALAGEEGNSVALVDLDLCLGDADVLLDAIPDYTLIDVTQNISRLDFSLLKRSLTKHSSGLFLLPRPVQMEDAALIRPDDLNRVIGLLKATFSHVILDLSKSYTPLDLLSIKLSDQVLLISQLDLPCLRNLVRLMMSFAEMEGVTDKVKIIINRLGLEDGQITLKKAETTIGKPVFWKLPNDYRAMVDARNNGVPLLQQAPKAKISLAIGQLADLISGVSPQDKSPLIAGKSSMSKIFNFWGGGGGGSAEKPAETESS